MQNKNIILNSLRLIRKCPVCNSKYTQNRVQIIDSNQDGVLVYFSCPVCFSSLLAQIAEMPFGMVGSAMLTDLQADEVLKFKKGETVSVDDVLNVYQELKK